MRSEGITSCVILNTRVMHPLPPHNHVDETYFISFNINVILGKYQKLL